MKADFAASMFEIEYGQHRMKTRLMSKAGPLHPGKYVDRFMESPGVPFCGNVSPKTSFNVP
jgi:hypothetical protein